MHENRDSTDALEIYKLPATFSLDNLKALQLSDDLVTSPGRNHLAHHIRRYPLDLRAQVQRVLMNKDQSDLAGALQDLFIALKDNGHKLRELVFAQVSAHLSDEHRQYFSAWLEHGFDQGYDDRFMTGSVLATGLPQKAYPLITLAAREKTTYTSYYQEAVDCLEYGQLEVAQELLEQEMLNPEGDPRTEEELLRVYSYSKDYESQERLRSLLQEQGRELSPGWDLPRTDNAN
ncbi:hypothetical protein DKW60_01865 [Leucothrix pacifica]|uniref:Uncharacterized protein n=2 Tax=Leucothrix pacifica TaxID=1247513 RepID=A0A317CNW6_9GAMM|nr:hypothetical protein DKW60_01865 [Leucothrix pacifica]